MRSGNPESKAELGSEKLSVSLTEGVGVELSEGRWVKESGKHLGCCVRDWDGELSAGSYGVSTFGAQALGTGGVGDTVKWGNQVVESWVGL